MLRRSFIQVAALVFTLTSRQCSAAVLELQIHNQVRDEALQIGSLRYQNSAVESYSVTRLSYLLSDFAFQQTNGEWVQMTNSVAWFDAEKERSSTQLGLPTGEYNNIRFYVGPNAELNHADISNFASSHPLNPNLNGLHWSWQGGYVFMALEGLWRDKGAYDGWSFHLARDTNRAAISLPFHLELTNSTRVEIAFDLSAVLQSLSFVKGGSSTHSREGDPLVALLLSNLQKSFRVVATSPTSTTNIPELSQTIDLPEKFTPYPFTISASFPIPNLPKDNPLIVERVQLGEKLFNDPLLSRDQSISCASCHDSSKAFSDSRRVSLGVENRPGSRNAMPLFNLAWKNSFFWDGRASTLRSQSLMPIQDHLEMDQQITNLVAKLASTYPNDFKAAFKSGTVSAENVSLALEAYLLSLTSFDSKFDRSLRREAELNEQEKRGFELFMTEYDPQRGQFGADCFHCHGGPLFQSQSFANNGLDADFKDSGREKVTHQTSDAGKFAIPSLRNIELTAPYMHDGRFSTLEQVVEHYSSGVKRSATLDPNLAKHPDGGLHLSTEDKQALVEFLKTLTDPKFRNPNLTTRSDAVALKLR